MTDTWKIGTDCYKMEELIKCNMHKQYHKSVFLKQKTPSSNAKQFTVFLWVGAFKTHLDVLGNSHGWGKWHITSSNKD